MQPMAFYCDLLVTLVSLAIVAQQVWALRGHFKSDTIAIAARLTLLAGAMTCVCFFLLVWLQPQHLLPQIVGIGLELASLAMFWAAIRASRAARLRFAFDDGHPHTLVTEGPYRYIRHPFYSSYLLFWLGWAIATWSPFAIVPLAILIAFYVVAARFEERLFAATPMAAQYDAYRGRAGLFWPKPWQHALDK